MEKQKIQYFVPGIYKNQALNRVLKDIEERLNDLEFKASKNGKKPEISRKEKMLLLMELGVIDYLFTLKISQKKIAQILHLVISATPSNIESDLSERFNPESSLRTEPNYQFLVKTFEELKLKVYAEKAQKVLEEIESKK